MAKLELTELRDRFRNAVDADRSWRDEALEDFGFKWGTGQWSASDLSVLAMQKRPGLVVNKIAPLLKLLGGYQRLNRYNPILLPRTEGDGEKAKKATALTDWVMDETDYLNEESEAFDDGITCGRGWLEVGYEWDDETERGHIYVRKRSPFDIYPDPECRKYDLSDANYLADAEWVDKWTLINAFPEQEELIQAVTAMYNADEDDRGDRNYWYDNTTSKVRLVRMWYRSTGHVEKQTEWGETRKVRVRQIRVASYLGDLILEDVESPYTHGFLPYVWFMPDWDGEGDIPRGVVRDLKDPQREINKRRSQLLHLLNTMANRGWFVQEGSLSPEELRKMELMGSTPGIVVKYNNTAPAAFDTTQLPTAFAQVEQANTSDLKEISGINEEMMGMNVPASASGRAIELKQQAAITSIAGMLDNLRRTKRQVMRMLWGYRGRQGVIQQFITNEMAVRITQDDGQPGFVKLNQKVPVADPLTGVPPLFDENGEIIATVMDDVSTWEFDIVLADEPTSPSGRTAAFWKLLEAAKQGVPIPPDILLEASDIPQKEAIKAKMAAIAAQQAQQPQGPQGGQPNVPGGVSPGSAPPTEADLLRMMQGGQPNL
jgi:hypothetical protein